MATLAEGPGENAVGEQDWPRASGLYGMAYAAWGVWLKLLSPWWSQPFLCIYTYVQYTRSYTETRAWIDLRAEPGTFLWQCPM